VIKCSIKIVNQFKKRYKIDFIHFSNSQSHLMIKITQDRVIVKIL
jgi:hypothetical protein